MFETPEAQCLGEQSVEYAIIPYTGDGAVSGAYAQAYQYQIPWTVLQTQGPAARVPAVNGRPHAGGMALPVSGQWLSWNAEASPLAFSTLKLSEETGDLVARWYNLGAEAAELKVTPSFKAGAVYASDVLERRVSKLAAAEQTVDGYKIVTQVYELED